MITTALAILTMLLLVGIPVAAALILLGFSLGALFSPFPLNRALGDILWSAADSPLLLAIPLFILMGEILVRTRMAEHAYATLQQWLGGLPGGLLHANIASATLFSSVSGSSIATAGTVGTVAMPQARRLGYDPRLFAGSIAAGGTLGIMIPPSINLIIYGFITQTSVPQLFAAGLMPGLLLALCFMGTSALIGWRRPKWVGGTMDDPARVGLGQSARSLLPIVGLVVLITGSLYAGITTPTESAALGVIGALGIAGLGGHLTVRRLMEALEGTMRTTGMIMLILFAARFLTFILGATGLGEAVEQVVGGLNTGPVIALLLIAAAYTLLGFFIETLALMVIVLPVIAPVVFNLGFDPVWFGVFFILLTELALITPPVGLNLYIVQATRTEGRLSEVMLGVIPYALIMLVAAGLLIAFPGLALFLPGLLP